MNKGILWYCKKCNAIECLEYRGLAKGYFPTTYALRLIREMIKRIFNNVRAKGMRQILKILLFITMLTPTVSFSQTLFETTKELAEMGSAYFQNELGNMYYLGEEVPQNYVEAVKWFRLAAEQGLAGAQFNLALMYGNGEGVPQNYVEAVKWYRLAAEQGHADGQFNLSVRYYKGEGVPQNGIMAYVWESLAAAQGNEGARTNRDISAKQLTPEQLARGQDIAARCFASGYKDCN
jgi:TPR repeat protein